jgi:hypothetical protein
MGSICYPPLANYLLAYLLGTSSKYFIFASKFAKQIPDLPSKFASKQANLLANCNLLGKS